MNGSPSPKQMWLVSFKPLSKGALLGFATIELPIGLVINDSPICTSSGKTRTALPSKPALDREGKQVEVSGKRQYAAILLWENRECADRWSQAVVDLVRRDHPKALP